MSESGCQYIEAYVGPQDSYNALRLIGKLFCGAEVVKPGKPWCAEHQKVASTGSGAVWIPGVGKV